MRSHEVARVTKALREGSSCPVVVETPGGKFVAKLRGAPQGVLALVAEIVVSELAEALGLPVPERVLLALPERVESLDKNDELRDLLDASVGLNLGYRFLNGALPFTEKRASEVDAHFATAVLVLDALVWNVDRTPRNPNIVVHNGSLWLLDHGAALPWSHWWAEVTEDSPGEMMPLDGHLFAAFRRQASQAAPELLSLLTRRVLESALSKVPNEMLAGASVSEDPARARAAYVAFLLKRKRSLADSSAWEA